MERPLTEPLLVAVLGPTASGKTTLAIELAERFSGEIVSCDSVALYREFEIGTAKPIAEERVRVPHHLLDVSNPPDAVTAGEYSRMSREKILAISARGRLPIVAGGTGLYLRALLEGLFRGPQRSEELRQRLRERSQIKGPGHLHRILSRLDLAAAQRIHANDVPKLIRAIEVCLASREKMTALWEKGREPLRGYRILRIGLNPDRELLYDRINQRARQMFDCGLIEETRALIERYGDIRPLHSLGYQQALQVIRGEATLDAAIQAAQQAHRNFAKRQMTWFRREPEVQWLDGFGDDPAIRKQAIALVQANN